MFVESPIDETKQFHENEAFPLEETHLQNVRRPSRNHSQIKFFLLIPVCYFSVWIFQLICLGFDNATKHWTFDGITPSFYHYDLHAFFFTLLNPTSDTALALMESVTNLQAFILMQLISVVGTLLQFATDKITTHITSIFFKDRIFIAFMSFFMVCNIFGLWSFFESGINHQPRFGIFLNTLLANFILIMLFPFFAYLFTFLDSEKVVTGILISGMKGCFSSINMLNSGMIESTDKESKFYKQNIKNQIITLNSLECLTDAALSSLKKKRHNVTADVLDALCAFSAVYLEVKKHAPKQWFVIPEWERNGSDFLILNDELIQIYTEKRVWIEWKILRQYQNVFNESIKWFTELCYLICVNTARIGKYAARNEELDVLDLCIKFFNTYIRSSINNNSVRVCYNTFFQYRRMAESLVTREENKTNSQELLFRGLKIARYMRYYASICEQRKLFFLIETIAQDLRVLCQKALSSSLTRQRTAVGVDVTSAQYRTLHDELLNVLLSMASFGNEAKAGVAKAQVILAVYYMENKQEGHALKIRQKLDRPENEQTLIAIQEELKVGSSQEYWEVTERGVNFAFVEKNLIKHINNFFSKFSFGQKQNDEYWKTFWSSASGIKLKALKELTSFELDEILMKEESSFSSTESDEKSEEDK